jgi:hypothetical protein
MSQCLAPALLLLGAVFLCGSHAILMPMVAASNLPAPLTNGELIQTALLDDVPSSDELAQWLLDKGLDTTDWGKENTKDVSKFWKAPWSHFLAVKLKWLRLFQHVCIFK